jgi:hypothetical protein
MGELLLNDILDLLVDRVPMLSPSDPARPGLMLLVPTLAGSLRRSVPDGWAGRTLRLVPGQD